MIDFVGCYGHMPGAAQAGQSGQIMILLSLQILKGQRRTLNRMREAVIVKRVNMT